MSTTISTGGGAAGKTKAEGPPGGEISLRADLRLKAEVHTPGFERCMAATRRAAEAMRLCCWSMEWLKVQDGDLVKLNPTLLRRVA